MNGSCDHVSGHNDRRVKVASQQACATQAMQKRRGYVTDCLIDNFLKITRQDRQTTVQCNSLTAMLSQLSVISVEAIHIS